MLVGRCFSKLSNDELQGKSKKSQAPSEAEGSAVPRTVPGNVFDSGAAYGKSGEWIFPIDPGECLLMIVQDSASVLNWR